MSLARREILIIRPGRSDTLQIVADFYRPSNSVTVLDAYGWPHDLSDEEALERLLALNGARAVHTG